MAFLNEYISKEDFERYKLSEIDSNFHPGASAADWTIDRQRDIYLRIVKYGREDFSHETWWIFHWHGDLLLLQIDYIASRGDVNAPQWSHKILRRFAAFNDFKLPPSIEERPGEILADLEEALLVYKDGGVFATATEYELRLGVDFFKN